RKSRHAVAAAVPDQLRAHSCALQPQLPLLGPRPVRHLTRAAGTGRRQHVRAAEADHAGADGSRYAAEPAAAADGADDDVDDAVDVRLLEPERAGGIGPILVRIKPIRRRSP